MSLYFAYGREAVEHLQKKDQKLALVIERVGHINRKVDEDLYSSVVHHIIGQQISSRAQQSIWERLIALVGAVKAETILPLGRENLQKIGITFKKADYILAFTQKVVAKEVDLEALPQKNDEEILRILSSLDGIGEWTAQMIMLFCMNRMNVFPFKDLAVIRGMRMVYRHRKIDRTLFKKYEKRLAPYCSVASLYFWAVAGGAIPELTDPAPTIKKDKKNPKTKEAPQKPNASKSQKSVKTKEATQNLATA